jgi:hypothetical protein
MKADASAAQKVTFFTSMDERAARAAPAVAAEPKKKK